jgi:hypothetical protein
MDDNDGTIGFNDLSGRQGERGRNRRDVDGDPGSGRTLYKWGEDFSRSRQGLPGARAAAFACGLRRRRI